MLTGQLRQQVDKIWNTFWTGGISNPLTVIEQFTYLLFESPFTNVNDQGLLGVFDDAASTRIIQLIERVNGNAGVG
jgi:hypothetical protein